MPKIPFTFFFISCLSRFLTFLLIGYIDFTYDFLILLKYMSCGNGVIIRSLLSKAFHFLILRTGEDELLKATVSSSSQIVGCECALFFFLFFLPALDCAHFSCMKCVWKAEDGHPCGRTGGDCTLLSAHPICWNLGGLEKQKLRAWRQYRSEWIYNSGRTGHWALCRGFYYDR